MAGASGLEGLGRAGRQWVSGSASGGRRGEGLVGMIDAADVGIGAAVRFVSATRGAARMLERVRRWRTNIFIAGGGGG